MTTSQSYEAIHRRAVSFIQSPSAFVAACEGLIAELDRICPLEEFGALGFQRIPSLESLDNGEIYTAGLQAAEMFAAWEIARTDCAILEYFAGQCLQDIGAACNEVATMHPEFSSKLTAAALSLGAETKRLNSHLMWTGSNGAGHDRNWSAIRPPKEWRSLLEKAKQPSSSRVWSQLVKRHPADISVQPGSGHKQVRISRALCESWGLTLPEFRD